MSVEVRSEQAAFEEAAAILIERMPASKVARLLAAWRAGDSDYLALRDRLFAAESVDSLYNKAKGTTSKH